MSQPTYFHKLPSLLHTPANEGYTTLDNPLSEMLKFCLDFETLAHLENLCCHVHISA